MSGFRLCYITDRRALEPQPLLPRILEAITAGVDLVQVREKDLDTRACLQLAEAAVAAAAGTATRIIVNDRLDVALAVGAAGVHLGGKSMPVSAVRSCVSAGFLIGASCHSLEESLAAPAAGADFILLGPIFESASKLRYGPPLGLAKLEEVVRAISAPVFALGGITVERARSCLEAGASGIAGISIFQNCESVERCVKGLRLEAS